METFKQQLSNHPNTATTEQPPNTPWTESETSSGSPFVFDLALLTMATQ